MQPDFKKKEGTCMAKTVRIIQKAKIYHPKSERVKIQNKSSEKIKNNF